MLYEPTPLRIKILFTLFILIAIYYFNWRIYTINPDSPYFSGLLLSAEIYGFITGLAHFMMTSRLTIRESVKPNRNFSVSVFIPTYNESLELVKRTLVAAKNMDYPHTTWLLDDGNRPEFKKLAESLGIFYLARPSHEDAKAGNLNYALKNSNDELIAIFDADHVPHKKFLVKTVGYFNDENVAFVQTPQDFYNLDSFQHRVTKQRGLMWTEQSLFFRVIQKGKDFWNAAFFCGSCAVIRRKALDEIGGFAIETITEDLHTSIKIHKKGYKSVYHPESLAYGIAPATIEPFITQRIRWGQGAMHVLRKESIIFDKKLTTAQKINYLASILTYLDGWQKGIFYITPIVVLATGWIPIKADGIELIQFLLPYVLINFLLTEELARGYGRTYFIEEYNMARYFAFAYASLFLLIPKKLKFKVTEKELRKVKTQIYLVPQQTLLVLSFLALPISLYLFNLDKLSLESLLISVFWATVNGILAYGVIRFSSTRNSFQRKNYRFKVPIPITLILDNPINAVVTDVSIDGFKLYGSLPANTAAGTKLKGILHFPTGNINFNSTVVVCPRVPPKANEHFFAVGCIFNWENTQDRDLLERNLYGSSDQLNLVGLSEKSKTPLERFKSLFNTDEKKVNAYLFEEWLPVLSDSNSVIGVCHLLDQYSPKKQYYAIFYDLNMNENIVHIRISNLSLKKYIVSDIKTILGYDFEYYVCNLLEH